MSLIFIISVICIIWFLSSMTLLGDDESEPLEGMSNPILFDEIKDKFDRK